jgi:hypothetical protein
VMRLLILFTLAVAAALPFAGTLVIAAAHA